MAEFDDKWMARVRCPAFLRVLFLRQLAVMTGAGIPLFDALVVLSEQPEHPNFGEAVCELSRQISYGSTLSRACSRFPKLFSEVHVALITMGERTGALVKALDKLADWGERDSGLVRKVRGALTYPAVVLAVATILMLVIFLTVLPSFVSMFEERGMKLPLLTQIVVAATHALTNPGFWFVAFGTILALYLVIRALLQQPFWKQQIFTAIYSTPLVGSLIYYTTLARFTGVFGTLLDSGADLLMSIRLAARASGNPLIQADEERLVRVISEGDSLGQSLGNRPELYPGILVQMTSVGEESSNLSTTYHRLAGFLDEEVGNRVEALGAALEPMMMVLVSIIVGSIILSVILPLYGFLNQIGQ